MVIVKPREITAHSSIPATIIIGLALLMGFVISLAIGSDFDQSIIDATSWLAAP
jgi:hypothetical protein